MFGIEYDIPAFVPSYYHTLDFFIDRIDSLLLMPHIGHQFKVTFTDTQLLCTSHLSPHHLKCYKLLKYLVNGEPFPRETRTATIIKPFLGAKTIFHSYRLKIEVWDHQYKEECTEEEDLSSCIYRVIRSLEDDMVKHDPFKGWPNKKGQSILRLRTLQKGIEKIKTTPTEAEFCRYIEPRGFQKCPAQILVILLCVRYKVLSVIMGMVLLFISIQLENAKKEMLVVGAVLFLCSIICISPVIHGIWSDM